MADYDAKAGVLTLHMDSPVSMKTVLKNIGLAYYYSDLVTSKMRAAWEDVWSKRMRVSREAAAKRFGYEFAKEMERKIDADADPKTIHYLYWMLGTQTAPPSSEKIQEPMAIPTPRQMHQRSRMKLPGMEWRRGPLSSELMEAICS
jgi:hypothetical protein